MRRSIRAALKSLGFFHATPARSTLTGWLTCASHLKSCATGHSFGPIRGVSIQVTFNSLADYVWTSRVSWEAIPCREQNKSWSSKLHFRRITLIRPYWEIHRSRVASGFQQRHHLTCSTRQGPACVTVRLLHASGDAVVRLIVHTTEVVDGLRSILIFFNSQVCWENILQHRPCRVMTATGGRKLLTMYVQSRSCKHCH